MVERKDREIDTIRIGDLFCGAGGLALGCLNAAQSLNLRSQFVFAIDADPTLEEVYACNHPTTRFVLHEFGHPNECNEAALICKRANVDKGGLDLLVAGPPCQSFSMAGKRQKHSDHWLVFHVCDCVDRINPKAIIIENVPGFSRAEDGRLLGRVRVRLNAAGYKTWVAQINAADFGVPQARVRCFTLAIRSDLYRDTVANPFAAMQPCFTEASTRFTTVADAISDLPPLRVGEGCPEILLDTPIESAYQRILRNPTGILYNHVASLHNAETVLAMTHLKPGERPKESSSHPLREKSYFRAAYGRLHPDSPAPTMTTQTHNPGSGRFTHYRDDRVLTVREVARLQSFPDAFRLFGFQAVQRRHIGNAVPPLLAQAIASTLLPLIVE